MARFALFLVLIIIVPLIIALLFMFVFTHLEKRGVQVRQHICTVLAFSPLIFIVGSPSFFGESGPLIAIGLIVAICAAMLNWKKDSIGIEAICSLILIFGSALKIFGAEKYHLSFQDMFEPFAAAVCGIGCLRYLIKCSPKK